MIQSQPWPGDMKDLIDLFVTLPDDAEAHNRAVREQKAQEHAAAASMSSTPPQGGSALLGQMELRAALRRAMEQQAQMKQLAQDLASGLKKVQNPSQ